MRVLTKNTNVMVEPATKYSGLQIAKHKGDENMRHQCLLALSLGLAVALTNANIALANVWQLPDREVDLTKEIGDAEKAGTISAQGASQLRSEEQKIAAKENKLKAKNNGTLKENDQKSIQEDVSRILKKLNKTVALKEDNTGKNLGDNRKEAPTPQVQSNKKEDIDLTANLRKELVDDKSLSSDAKNVKIITINGVVTLRGVVKNDAEKARISSFAEKLAGKDNVLNELKIVQ